MPKNKNYIFVTFLTTAIIIACMLVLSYVPSFKVGDTKIKRVNILSDIIETPVDSLEGDDNEQALLLAEADSVLLSLEQQPQIIDEPQEESKATPVEQQQVSSKPWEMEQSVGTAANSITDLDRPLIDSKTRNYSSAIGSHEIIAIDDYGQEQSALAEFRKALTSPRQNRPMRIAVLGDSFIENDIITADLREQFQGELGGNGVGFVAFSTPIAKYRATIKHTFEGWETYSVMSMNKTPEKYHDKFYVSGLLCVPEEGATVSMASTTFRKYTKQSTVARLLFINEKSTELRVTINDSLQRVFKPESSAGVQQIVISGNIEKIDMSVHNVDGFVGYGIVFEDRSGVCVDNYSVRGTSGLPIFKTNTAINRSIGKMLGYDLVILEFGLNIMQADVLKYDSFSQSLSRIIRYVKTCFPEASIMVMGVGDRCHNTGSGYETMEAVYGVFEAQRAAAEAEGAAFWNTFEAMGGHNSMKGFVERKWAGKDHLHIGYGGGQYIAQQMYRSLMDFELEPEAEPELEPVLDTLNVETAAEIQVDSLGEGSVVDSLAMSVKDSLEVHVMDSVKSDTIDVNQIIDSLNVE